MPNPGIMVLSQMFLIEVSDGVEINYNKHKRDTKNTKYFLCVFCVPFVFVVVNLFLRKFIPAIAIQQQP
jgi:hypothetical protein